MYKIIIIVSVALSAVYGYLAGKSQDFSGASVMPAVFVEQLHEKSLAVVKKIAVSCNEDQRPSAPHPDESPASITSLKKAVKNLSAPHKTEAIKAGYEFNWRSSKISDMAAKNQKRQEFLWS